MIVDREKTRNIEKEKCEKGEDEKENGEGEDKREE